MKIMKRTIISLFIFCLFEAVAAGAESKELYDYKLHDDFTNNQLMGVYTSFYTTVNYSNYTANADSWLNIDATAINVNDSSRASGVKVYVTPFSL